MRTMVTFGGKGQQAYQELKRRIVRLELAPGQPLTEAELTNLLGSSRTPIRKAIQRLAAEKLIVVRSRKTPFVAPILANELAEVIENRRILEVPAARMTAERGTAAQRKQLGATCASFRKAARAGDQLVTLSSDGTIHDLVASISGNSFPAEYAERLAASSQRIWWLSMRDPRRDDAFIACHDELTHAIRAADAKDAGQAADDHVTLFRSRLSQLVAPATLPQRKMAIRRRA